MPADLASLICRDHEDLDRALVALSRCSAPAEAESLLDTLRICLDAHTAAHSAVLRDLLGPVASSRVVAELVRSILDEHRRQARDLGALASLRFDTSEWHDAVLELRIAILDHRGRDEFIGVTLFDQVGPISRRSLARVYATERLRRFGTVEPAPIKPAARALALN